MPDEILSDSHDAIVARLNDAYTRKWVISKMVKKLKGRKLNHYSYAVVANYPADTSMNGKSIEAINLLKGNKHNARQEAETILSMVQQGGAGMVFHGMSEVDVKRIMQYPFNMFGSDAGIRAFGQGAPHPRGYGTHARVLGRYVRTGHVLTLEEAIRRMSSLPAQRFQLKDRGMLKEGLAADIVLFDENEVLDLSTYEHPHQYSTGFRYVLVNGELVLDSGRHTCNRPGRALRAPSAQIE